MVAADSLAYVRDAANGYLSCEIPLDDGLELSIRQTESLQQFPGGCEGVA
jgi:hypothetical protein